MNSTGTVGACADAVEAWKYPYDQSCGASRVPVSAITGSICQVKPDCVSFDLYGHPYGPCTEHAKLPSGLLRIHNGRKSVSENYACSTFSHGLYSTRTGLKCSKDRAHPHGMQVLTVSGPSRTRKQPRSFI